MDTKKTLLVLLLIVFSNKIIGQQKVDDLPKEIIVRYGIDMVPNEKSAIEISKIIIKERFVNLKFKYFKPFIVSLIADGKLWDLVLSPKKEEIHPIIYHIRINKNTGEIINFWIEK
jgi:hypothetical protein